MLKLQWKISGCSRTIQGAEAFCALRSYFQTATRQHANVLDALWRLFEGGPMDAGGHRSLPRTSGDRRPTIRSRMGQTGPGSQCRQGDHLVRSQHPSQRRQHPARRPTQTPRGRSWPKGLRERSLAGSCHLGSPCRRIGSRPGGDQQGRQQTVRSLHCHLRAAALALASLSA
jgi:hypothetical protein